MILEICNKVFDGIQPLLRHTPPRLESFSISVTSFPKSAALKAAAYPPGPAPMITTLFLPDIYYFLKNFIEDNSLLTFDVNFTASAPSITLWS